MDDRKGRVRERYRARLARTEEDLRNARALRHLCFYGSPGIDSDRHDDGCRHVLIEDAKRKLAATYRIRSLRGPDIEGSYAAERYDLSRLSGQPGILIELGRFCVRPGPTDPDLLRVAWGFLAGTVLDEGASMLFGCTSFGGTDPAPYSDAFAFLAERHLAPPNLRPGRKALEVATFPTRRPDIRAALRQMPPLLRAYVGMGGWTSDHTVIDRELGTLHVFTALEVARIPTARIASLRALAAR